MQCWLISSGIPEDPGLIYLTTQELFERCAALTDKKVDISLSFLEIYNETIRDLLVPLEESKPLQLREDANQRISVPGLSTETPLGVDFNVLKCRLTGRSMKS
jgi:kinesin family member 18/19